jgi:ribose/xylose/arabinose/galactoside ABC-type transport system permease subunit
MSVQERITAPADKPRRVLPVEFGVAIVLLAAILFFAVQRPDFHSPDNIRLLMKQSAELAVIATGMTLVIATGGIDVSVGSVVGLSGMMLAFVATRTHGNLLLACLAALGTGAACGLLNGLLIARAKLPPIIVTLATFAAARAAVQLFNNGGGISDLPPALQELFDHTNILNLPVLFWIGLLTLVGGWLILRRTKFGRELLSLGGNRTATRLAGVRTERVEILAYVLCGLLAGLAAIIVTARAASAEPNAGLYFELLAITAVVLGGTTITGGKATLLGTGLGVLTINVLVSGGRLYGQEDQVARFLVGAALLLAVEVQRARKTG